MSNLGPQYCRVSHFVCIWASSSRCILRHVCASSLYRPAMGERHAVKTERTLAFMTNIKRRARRPFLLRKIIKIIKVVLFGRIGNLTLILELSISIFCCASAFDLYQVCFGFAVLIDYLNILCR
jgi:hypothetical protein